MNDVGIRVSYDVDLYPDLKKMQIYMVNLLTKILTNPNVDKIFQNLSCFWGLYEFVCSV